MPTRRLLAVSVGVLALALPTAAQAGTVTGFPPTYTGADVAETVNATTSGNLIILQGDEVLLGGAAQCTPNPAPTRLDCQPATTVSINTLGGDDTIVASALSGTNLLADGGVGDDEIRDGAGNDTITGGAGGDRFFAGPGSDVYNGGDGDDTIYYSDRAGAVTIALNGTAVSGEAGEGDTVGGDVEGAYGGAGNDVITANALGNRLYGGPGNDTIKGGAGEDRIEGNEGDDVIDSRDGRYDSIDCGSGNDTLLADAGDSAANCEAAPDRDGDGTPNEQDCAPDNAAIHPGAGEIVGNAVDEDCAGGPQYLRVTAPLGYSTRARGSSARFVRLTLSEIKPGDTIEIRCTGGKGKGCPFTTKTQTGKAGKPKVNLLSLFKKRYLKRNAVVEIRVTRPNEIGRVQRLKVTKKGVVKSELLCLSVGATAPAKCT